MRVLVIVHDEDAGPGVFNDVFSEREVEVDRWLPAEGPAPASPEAYDAILSFGGAAHPHQADRHPWLATEKLFLAQALQAQVPALGVCLGYQLIAEAGGTAAQKLAHPEIGWYQVELTPAGADDPVLGPIANRFAALEWHSYAVSLPPGATALAHSGNCLQAYRLGASAWGIQFHAEVTAADFQHWLDNYTSDEDAVAEGIDPLAIARDSEGRLSAWHELGRGICERFLQVAQEQSSGDRRVQTAL